MAPIGNKIDAGFGLSPTTDVNYGGVVRSLSTSEFGQDITASILARRIASELIKSAGRQALTVAFAKEGKVSGEQVVADGFGNAIGNSIVEQMQYNDSVERLVDAQFKASIDRALADPEGPLYRQSASFKGGLQDYMSQWPGDGEVQLATYTNSAANVSLKLGMDSKEASDMVFDIYGRLYNDEHIGVEERTQLKSILKSAGYDVGKTDLDVSNAAGRFVVGNNENNLARLDFDARTGFYSNFSAGDGNARYTYVTGDDGKTVVVDFTEDAAKYARKAGYTTDQAILEKTDYRLYDAVLKGMFSTKGAIEILIGGVARPGESGPHGEGRGLDLWSMQGEDGRTYGFSKGINTTESDLVKRFNDNLWVQRRETGLTQIIGPYRYAGVIENPESMNRLVSSVRQAPGLLASSLAIERANAINNLLFGPYGHQTHEHLTIR